MSSGRGWENGYGKNDGCIPRRHRKGHRIRAGGNRHGSYPDPAYVRVTGEQDKDGHGAAVHDKGEYLRRKQA